MMRYVSVVKSRLSARLNGIQMRPRLQGDCQRRRMVVALDLAHLRTLEVGQVGQPFLGDAPFRAQCTRRRAEGLG